MMFTSLVLHAQQIHTFTICCVLGIFFEPILIGALQHLLLYP